MAARNTIAAICFGALLVAAAQARQAVEPAWRVIDAPAAPAAAGAAGAPPADWPEAVERVAPPRNPALARGQ